jgi:carboxypeptidase Taq
VPGELRAEMSRMASLSTAAWVEARKQSEFALFLPYLAQSVDLRHRYIDCFDNEAEDYDVLLDDFEPGMTTAEVKRLFDDLKTELVPLIAAISQRGDVVDDRCLHGHFPAEQQRNFCLQVITCFGFNAESWRLDSTVHPFANNSAISDIRVTTRYNEAYLAPALFGSMHETGHGLYENGISPSLERTPLSNGASLGLHESQSRMWENLVGRSRSFWVHFFPALQAAFPEHYAALDVEDFYRAINKVQPSAIRVEADEATYNLHIILRFELEQEIISGQLALEDLPEAWNDRMRQYLGVQVADDAHGVLQDIHWSGGMLGYFPTYALGNIISCQIWEKAQAALPGLAQQFEQGQFMSLREWLRDALHRHGRKFTPRETLQRVVGGPIDVGPYVRYLRHKFGEIYHLNGSKA